jgi:hypothetical protein
MKIIKNKNSFIIPISLLMLLVCLILIPLFKPGFPVTDDGDWMIIRLTAFYQAFADGQFPVRFLMRLNNNYGYPVSNFLYPGYLYIGSLLRLFHLPYVAIVKLIFGGSVAFCALFSYLWLRRFFSSISSFIGACSLLVSPYFLYDFYKRGSVGELLATSVVIILLWSIESGYVWLISPITALLFVSHNTLALIFSFVVGGYIIVRKKFDAFLPVVIGVWMSSFFWIPAIFERSFVRFDLVQVSNPFDYGSVSQTLVLIGIPLLLPLFLFLRKRKDTLDKEFLYFSAVSTCAVIGSSMIGTVFWKTSFFIHFVQFPYRLLSVVFITGPWLIAFLLHVVGNGRKKVWIGFALLVVLSAPSVPLFMKVHNVVREEGFYTTNEGTTTVQDEYLPRWVEKNPAERTNSKLVLFSGKGTIESIVASTKKIDARLIIERESVIQFNTVFYPGWGGTLNGKPINISYQNTNGLMRVSVPKGEHHISFEFRETAFRYIADFLSSLGILFYGGYLSYLLVKGAKRK